MKKLISFVLCLSLVASLVACGGQNVQSSSNETNSAPSSAPSSASATYKIGGIGPITGGAAIYGLAVQRGIQIAIDEINANGGIGGYKVEYRFEDDEHDAEKAVNAYNVLKGWGMQALIGTTTSSPCIAVAAESSMDNLFQITPSGSAVECVDNDTVFRVCFSDPDQGAASAKFINDKKLAKKVGVIYDSSDVYSSGVREKFAEEAKKCDFEIVETTEFTADTKTDFTTQLQKLKSAGAELVFMPFYYSEAAIVLTQANTMDYKPIFFGVDGLDGLLTVENFDLNLAEGVMLLTPFVADANDSLTQNFVNTYKKLYNEVPNQFAADSYDAAYIVKAALEDGNANPNMSYSELCDILKESMLNIKVNGLTGQNMTWDESGEPKKDPKAVIIKNGAYVGA